jgi:hypothetical protein
MRRGWLILLVITVQRLVAGDSAFLLRGLSVYADNDERNLPLVLRWNVTPEGKPAGASNRITIQFDVLADKPPDLRIRFAHCNRDWKEDDNLFVNDIYHNTSFILQFEVSPGGVKSYTYRYINSFPDDRDAVRFDYSGNWIFRITDKGGKSVFAEGRFFVVDQITPTSVAVANEYLTTSVSPYNQIQSVSTRIRLPQEVDGFYYTTVDVYQNRRLYNPYRIDAWDRDPYTMVEGFNTGERLFTITNIPPGNEYRVLDLSNVTRYPNGALVRNVDGADQLRLFWRTGPDHNGAAQRNTFTGLNGDYLEVVFRLAMTATDDRALTRGGREIFVAGEFNFWNPGADDRLAWDETEGYYVVKKFLRRGIYDYQYVAGTWSEETQRVERQNWLALEGNDWRTTNIYTVLVYYNDPRFGGFDRIVGIGRAESPRTLPGSN